MFPPAARFAVLLLLVSTVAAAPARYRLRDGGQVRDFEPVSEGGLTVLYQAGRTRTLHARRRITGEVLVILTDIAQTPAIAERSGAVHWRPAPVLPGAVLLTIPGDAAAVLAAAESLAALPAVRRAEPILARTPAKRWVPDDPLFADNAANAGYQWHLLNTGARGGLAGVDIHVASVWDTWRGAGIRIGILDDGLETGHPDLTANVDTANDYDWNGGDNDPAPNTLDWHGTACAGLAAGRGNNGLGICGAAPEATVVGMRLISPESNDTTEAAAFLHRNDIIQIKNNSWGPDDFGNVVEGPGTLGAAALQQSAETGRGGLGTVIFWAGGNGLASGDDSNYDGYANSIYTIALGAVTDAGRQASYSEPGANLLLCAPSGGGAQDLTTTDRTGSIGYNAGGGPNYASADYTNNFDGTSAAVPLTAGATALLLQSRPSLGWRDVKEILIRSAGQVHSEDEGWFTNAAGFHFNDKYGAGLLDIGAAVSLAAGWTNLGPAALYTAVSPGALAIPDNSAAGVTKSFAFTPGQNLRVEQLTLTVGVTHSRRGQLNYTLTSPSGTISRLARPRPDNNADLAWTFATPQFWGEAAAGTWTLRVTDTLANRTGTLNSATLTLHGTVPDADGDGFPADAEGWFGTSDTDSRSFPALTLQQNGDIVTLTFPSVPGNAYGMETSTDLLTWSGAALTGTLNASATTWTDTNVPFPARRYYRVRKP
jgi:subtilisin-like proprotein convertase family protein